MQVKFVCLFSVVALCLALAVDAAADNSSYAYAGGAFSVGQTIDVQSAPLGGTKGMIGFSCPVTSFSAGTYLLSWTCAGGSVTISSSDNSLVFRGSMIAGSMSFSGSGGGRGGHTSYAYQFDGSFTGTITSGGVTQAANGSVSQYVKTSGQIGSGSAAVTSGSLGWNSAYSPLILGDAANNRILIVDNVDGANLGSYGTAGTGVGNFGTVAGLALDAAGRIYIADATLDRLVRIDNGGGTNWTALGTSGSGINQFNQPHGLAVDTAGRMNMDRGHQQQPDCAHR
jgi:hypothetical protein